MSDLHFRYAEQLPIALLLTSVTVVIHGIGMSGVRRCFERFWSPAKGRPRSRSHLVFMVGIVAIMIVTVVAVGEPTGFGITVELLMLASAAAVVGGLFIGTESAGKRRRPFVQDRHLERGAGARAAGGGAFLCAVPPLFHELANSTLLHAQAPGAVDVTLGASELLPAMAILPFMLYQLAGFGTLHFVVPKPVNWAINLAILGLIIAAPSPTARGAFGWRRRSADSWCWAWPAPCSTASSSSGRCRRTTRCERAKGIKVRRPHDRFTREETHRVVDQLSR